MTVITHSVCVCVCVLQTMPTDMRALQDFDEEDKLQIKMNDVITIIEGRSVGGTLLRSDFCCITARTSLQMRLSLTWILCILGNECNYCPVAAYKGFLSFPSFQSDDVSRFAHSGHLLV